MEKILLKSRTDFFNFIQKLNYMSEEIEDLFGINFLNSAGQSFYDYEEDDRDSDDFEWDEVDFKVTDEELVPKSYPCLLFYVFCGQSNRSDDLTIRLFEYAYPEDFQ